MLTTMKSDKATFHTFNKTKCKVTCEETPRKSSTMCLYSNMNCNSNRKLLVITAWVLLCSVSPVQGNGVPPFGRIERTPPRENCTGQACVEQKAQVDFMRAHRLKVIKNTIFEKLGLEKRPNLTTEIPKVVIQKAVRKVLARSNPKSEPAFPGGYFAEVSEIVSFAEEVSGKSHLN